MKIEFETTPDFDAEINRILPLTNLTSPAQLFRSAFTLLRIHVDAALRKNPVTIGDEVFVELPFLKRSTP